MFARIRIGLLLACLTWWRAEAAITQVRVTGGTIRGVVADGVSSFKGVPFASPPIGTLRWRPPQEVQSWSGVKRATAFGLPCTQASLPPPASGEDCLYLNVWTAADSSKAKLPVMLWIHGGSLTAGTPSYPVYDGTQFARDGVVLLSISYRLGPFGFLSHSQLSAESGKGSGAYGFQDQIAALIWVQKNIEVFGGDPNNVTLFGESAGAWSVSVLAASSKAKGLFHRAIAQSGAILAPPKRSRRPSELFQNSVSLEFAERNGSALLQSLGANSIDEARKKSPSDILAAVERIQHETLAVVDGEIMIDENARVFEAGRFNDVPLLLGHNSGEGIGNVPAGATPEALKAAPQRSPCPTQAADVLALYRHATLDEAVAMIEESQRDGDFGWSAWTWARLQNAKGRSKVYLYYFDVHPSASPKGAMHFADVPIVFGTQDAAGNSTSALIRRYWINFARNGDPNAEGLSPWPPFESRSEMAMVFDESSSARQLPNLDRIKAFDELFKCAKEKARD